MVADTFPGQQNYTEKPCCERGKKETKVSRTVIISQVVYSDTGTRKGESMYLSGVTPQKPSIMGLKFTEQTRLAVQWDLSSVFPALITSTALVKLDVGDGMLSRQALYYLSQPSHSNCTILLSCCSAPGCHFCVTWFDWCCWLGYPTLWGPVPLWF